MKILAVDDDTCILDLLKAVLESSGYSDVTICASPLLALSMVKQEGTRFDCLLLDIQMPEMDGIKLCRKVRAVTGYEDTPIIMLTAMTEKSYIERAFIAGATDYIVKPFDVIEIGARIRIASKLNAANAALYLSQHRNTPRHNEVPSSQRPCLSRQEMVDLFADELRHPILRRAS